MTRKAIRSGLQTGLMVALILTTAAIFSVGDDGVNFTTGGVEMKLTGDFQQGLQIRFIAPN